MADPPGFVEDPPGFVVGLVIPVPLVPAAAHAAHPRGYVPRMARNCSAMTAIRAAYSWAAMRWQRFMRRRFRRRAQATLDR